MTKDMTTMTTQVFIDGEAGTTGLQIRERLENRADISLIQLDDARRKDADARKTALNSADIVILCLPDAAAKEAVAWLDNPKTRVIDASSAHRVADGWTYGFAEMAPGQADAIARARFVSNPGCYPQGFIASVRPLIEAGLLPADFPLTYNAISGYSGGGKAMIADFEAEGSTMPPYLPYGLTLEHKHLPEMLSYAGIVHQPVFQPSVGRYAQGMIGAVPLQLWALEDEPTGADIHAVLAERYANSTFVKVAPLTALERSTEITPEVLNGTNSLHLHVCANDETGQVVLLSVYDNLGKGASGAAVQNLNLMTGMDESTGLTKG